MTVLVTGGTGFIGSNLIERLRQRGDDVRCLAKDTLNAAMLESLNVEVVLGDLNNGIGWEKILDGVDYVYHLAGVTRARNTREYYEGNWGATKQFLKACRTHCKTLKRFVFVSSLAAVGPSLNGENITEETEYHPVSHYGKSKMLAEREVLSHTDSLPLTIIRPSAVYGPRERDMFEYMKLIRKGIQPLIGFNKKLLNLIHADDLVNGMILAAENPVAEGQIYFLGSHQNYTTQEIGNAIRLAITDCKLKFTIHIPHALVYGIGAVSEVIGKISGRKVFFNLQKAREATQPAWMCSTEKAKEQIGFRQTLSLEEGMWLTYRWYKEHHWL